MATGREMKLTGATGEFLVSAELCRRGLLATPFSGNVPHYDIIASGPRGGHVPIQVKAINGGSWQFNLRKFLNITLDGNRQIPGRVLTEPYPGLLMVLVVLGGTGNDRFFVMTWRELRDLIAKNHRRYLRRHGGSRPKSPGSFHTAVAVADITRFENCWQTIVTRVGRTA
jgi:hypothetical protein